MLPKVKRLLCKASFYIIWLSRWYLLFREAKVKPWGSNCKNVFSWKAFLVKSRITDSKDGFDFRIIPKWISNNSAFLMISRFPSTFQCSKNRPFLFKIAGSKFLLLLFLTQIIKHLLFYPENIFLSTFSKFLIHKVRSRFQSLCSVFLSSANFFTPTTFPGCALHSLWLLLHLQSKPFN